MKVKAKLAASLKIWVVIYPALTLFLYLFSEQLSSLPVYIRTLFMTLILVPLIVFMGIPLLELMIRIFSTGKQKE